MTEKTSGEYASRFRWLLGGGCIWLVFSSYLLLLFSRFVDASYLTHDNEYLAVVLLQIMIFLIPAAVFCRVRH